MLVEPQDDHVLEPEAISRHLAQHVVTQKVPGRIEVRTRPLRED